MEIMLIPDQADLPSLLEHQAVEFVWALVAAGEHYELALDGQALDPFIRPGSSAWRWRWNPGAAVGRHTIVCTAHRGDASTSHTWAVRVAPGKLAQEHYELLLADLQRLGHNLAYALAGAAAEGAALERGVLSDRSKLEEYYVLLDERLGPLVRAVERIAERPAEVLREEAVDLPIGQARELDDAAIATLGASELDDLPPEAAPAIRSATGGWVPRHVRARRAAVSFDTYEHRLLKHLLAGLARRARTIGALAQREVERLARNEAFGAPGGARLARARQIAQGCASALGSLRTLRGLPFLQAVGPLGAFRGPTQLLRRHPAYREVYRSWQALRQQPLIAFDSPLFSMPIADLPQLYETWCALQVAQIVIDSGGVVREQQLVMRQAGDDALDLVLSLPEHVPLLVIAQGDTTLRLRYQPRYRSQQRAGARGLVSLDRHTRVPDLAIEVERAGRSPRVVVFDAKYRLDAGGRGVPQDALADAYAYLGAIGYAGTRATAGAWLLYPGRGALERYPSDVGAVPLLPGHAHDLAQLISEMLIVD